MDVWHMLPAVGETIMRVMFGLPLPDCPDAAIVVSSALRVTPSNVDKMFALQDQRREAAIATPNLYSTTVAAAIVKRYGNISGPEVKSRIGKSKAGTSG